MPSSSPLWTDFLSCSSCNKEFSITPNRFPITLLCGHSVCQECIRQIQSSGCLHDPNTTTPEVLSLGINFALLQLVQKQKTDLCARPHDPSGLITLLGANYVTYYDEASDLLENLALYLCDIKNGILPQKSDLTKPMQRKLVTLIQSQLALEEGRIRALRACRALGERALTELILSHQNPTTLSVNLWTAVRARGCQFLGPAMQEEALKLILLALEDGSELSRKVLVMFVVQKLQRQFPLSSKTSIGHVVQLLYRASCFVVKKRDGDSSLMKLKEVYRTYPALRREHDAQVVQIAREAGLRIAPDQWSALLYGDQEHKSHMQSVIDRLQSGESLKRSIQDLFNALEKSSDPSKLRNLIPHFEYLADVSVETISTQNDDEKKVWDYLIRRLQSVKIILHELIDFTKTHTHDSWQDEETLSQSAKFKTSFCRDMKTKARCPRGSSCSFAHTEEELHHYRNKRKKAGLGSLVTRDNVDTKKRPPGTFSAGRGARNENHSFQEEEMFDVHPATQIRLQQPTLAQQGHYFHQNISQATHQHPSVPQQHRPAQNLGMHVPPPMIQPPRHTGDLYHVPMRGVNTRYSPIYNTYEAMRFNHPLYHPVVTQSSNYPVRHSAPQVYSAHSSRLTEEGVSAAGNQSLPQFTVTLSFQSKPSVENVVSTNYQQDSVMYQPDNRSTSMKEGVMISSASDAYFAESVKERQCDGRHIASTYVAPMRPVVQTLQPFLPPANAIETREPVTAMTFRQRQPNALEHVNTQHCGMIPPVSYQFEAPSAHNRDPAPVAVVAPQPAAPRVIASDHGYEPDGNVLFSNNTMHPAMPCLMSPPTHPTQNPPVLIPVVPVTHYQVVDSSQVHYPMQGDGTQNEISEPATANATIPISIGRATIAQLEERKKQILTKMIQNQRTKNEEISTAPSDFDQSYDVWNCESYSSLLKLQTGFTVLPENLKCEDYSTNVVDVIAELDTGTTQVTMRGTDDINPSYARNQRTLDDPKMHRMLLEKNDDMNNSESDRESSQSLQALAHCSGGLQDDVDDDIIPFSDRPIVSKYGPIARSVRTRPINTDLVQVNANADVNTNPVAATNEVGHSGQSKLSSSSIAYSSLDSLSAISYFPVSHPRYCENLAVQNSKSHSGIPTTRNKRISPTQAASNLKLLHREETAIQHNKSQINGEDLRLAMELQQIELGIQQKCKHNI